MFDLSKENRERCFSSRHKRRTKKNFWVPMRNRTSDLLIPRSDAAPLSHKDSTVSVVYYEAHMTRVRPVLFFLYSTLVTRRKTSFSIFMYFYLEISDGRLYKYAFSFVSSFLSAFCQITSWRVYQTDFLTVFPIWLICKGNSYLT